MVASSDANISMLLIEGRPKIVYVYSYTLLGIV